MQKLLAEGISFDLISDAQLQQLKVVKDSLIAPGGSYRVIFVPAARRMSTQTLRRFAELRGGGREGDSSRHCRTTFPGTVSWKRGARNCARCLPEPAFANAEHYRGRAVAARATRHPPGGAARAGLAFIRRCPRGWLRLLLREPRCDRHSTAGSSSPRRPPSAWILDPLTGRAGGYRGDRRNTRPGTTRVYLQLASGASLAGADVSARQTSTEAIPDAWRYVASAGDGVEARGTLAAHVPGGRSRTPAAVSLAKAGSWTTLADDGRATLRGHGAISRRVRRAGYTRPMNGCSISVTCARVRACV